MDINHPPAKDEMEVHVYFDGGGDSFGAVAFLRWNHGSEYKMKRIYAASKVVPPKSKLSVPRREVCSLVMGTKIGKELSAELEINPKRVYLHSDSLIAMFWLEKEPGQLNTYVANRIREIQEGNFKVYHTSSNTNPADFLTKVKPASTYLDNPLWEMGPDYMTSDDWSEGRSIKEIKERMSPTAEQNKEIDAEVKKSLKRPILISVKSHLKMKNQLYFISLS